MDPSRNNRASRPEPDTGGSRKASASVLERSEEVDGVPVWVLDDGVALAPESVPRFLVPVAQRGQLGVFGVYLGRGRALKGQRDAAPAGGRGPGGVYLLRQRDGVPGYTQAAGGTRLGVRLVRDALSGVQAEPVVET